MENGNKGDIVIYQTKDGLTKIDVRFEDETVWLTQTIIDCFCNTNFKNIEKLKKV